jgi:thiamine pyrophosphokinase
MLMKSCGCLLLARAEIAHGKLWPIRELLENSKILVSDWRIDTIILNAPPVCMSVYEGIGSASATRICTDGAANVVRGSYAGSRVSVTAIVGDFDSVSGETLQYFIQRGVKIVNTLEQDTTDLDKAIRYIRFDCPSPTATSRLLCIMGSIGNHAGRIDHFFGVIRSMYASRGVFQVVSIGSEAVMMVLSDGQHTVDLPSRFVGSHCGIIPMFGPVESIVTRGLRWELSGPSSFDGLVSTSNAIVSASVQFDIKGTVLFTVTIPA